MRGRTIKIGRGTQVLGMVYFVDNIEVDDKAILANKPIKITEEELYYKK